jgi:hypothetical protein
MSELFRLMSTFEYSVQIKSTQRWFRIDVLASVSDSSVFRTRIWIENTYNLYPTLLNCDAAGRDLHLVHSADELNTAITSVIVDDPRCMSGVRCGGEQEALRYATRMIDRYAESLDSG